MKRGRPSTGYSDAEYHRWERFLRRGQRACLDCGHPNDRHPERLSCSRCAARKSAERLRRLRGERR